MNDDPTRNERQRLYRMRRKAEAEGLVEVVIAGDRYWVSASAAAKMKRIAEAERAADDPQPR